MKKIKYSRLLSTSERLYIISNQISPPFSIQLIVEGNGEIDKEKLKFAILKASEANPGSRLKLKGHLGFSRWIDSGKTPPLREINNNNWDGMSTLGIPSILNRFCRRWGSFRWPGPEAGRRDQCKLKYPCGNP